MPIPSPRHPRPWGLLRSSLRRDSRQAGVPVGRPAGFPSPHSHQCSGDNNTPHTHPGGDWQATGAPLPEREASRSTGIFSRNYQMPHVVHSTRAARGPHHTPSRPACPGPSVRPSASTPGCRLCSGGRGGGRSLGVGGWRVVLGSVFPVWGVAVTWLQACGTCQAAESGGTPTWRSRPSGQP